MAYCTLSDLKKLIPESSLVQLTDDSGTGMVDETRTDEAIAQADADIDAYCGTRFQVPFSPVPDIIRKISVDLTIYNLYSRRLDEIPKTREDRYRDAVKKLEGIGKGTISIGEDPRPDPSGYIGGPEADRDDDDLTFDDDSLENY